MQSAVGCNVQALIHRRLVGCGTVPSSNGAVLPVIWVNSPLIVLVVT